MKLSVLFITIIFSPLSYTYVPDYKMIMSRVAENHGRGYYEIKQDMMFSSDGEPLVIEETWVVTSEGNYSLTLKGKGILKNQVNGTIIYKGGKKFFVTSALRTTRPGPDYMEYLFHFRYSKKVKPKIVAMGIAPAESLKNRPIYLEDKSENMKPFPRQNFLRLSRSGGVINYAIGIPTPPNQSEDNPGIWIEQDRFHITKIRNKNSSTVDATQYTRYPRKFWFPKQRTYSWAGGAVPSQIISIRPLPRSNSSALLISPNRLNKEKQAAQLKLPENKLIQTFYQRFR